MANGKVTLAVRRCPTARPAADGTRCEIKIETEEGRAIVRLTREETFKLGQTLLLMTGSLRDG